MKKEVNENNEEKTLVWKNQTKDQEPYLYQVILHNDDFTPMEFVVHILERFFFMDRGKATAIMFKAHINGEAICGVFTKEVALSKIYQVMDYARIREHPLFCSLRLQEGV